MSTETNIAGSVPAAIGSPEQLVAAREQRGWSMSDVASKLGMMPRQIDAIESGRWEALPGHAFVRGAIRAYGKALKADVTPLLATVGEKTHAPELRASASLEAPLPRHGALGFDNGGSGSRLTWILLGVLGVVAIAMYFGRGADLARVLESGASAPAGRSIETVPVPQPAAVDTSRSTVAPASGPAAAASGAGLGASGPGAGAASGDTRVSGANASPAADATAGGSPSAMAAGSTTSAGGAAQPTTQDAAVPRPGSDVAGGVSGGAMAGSTSGSAAAGSTAGSAAAGATAGSAAAGGAPDALVLRFERESWVEVRDAGGRTMLSGTQPAQSVRELSGQKPYSLTLGNAPYVSVEHAGRSVDLGPVTRKGVARLTID